MSLDHKRPGVDLRRSAASPHGQMTDDGDAARTEVQRWPANAAQLGEALSKADSGSRQRLILHLQQTHGNANVRRLLAHRQGATETARTGPLLGQQVVHPILQRSFSARVKKWKERLKSYLARLGVKPDVEWLLEELKTRLERAGTLCSGAATVFRNEDARRQLAQAGTTFTSAAGKIGKGLKAGKMVRTVINFIDAVDKVAGADVSREPDKAARAFGKLFAATGALGQWLPPPFSAYFALLAKFENFFENMSYGVDVSKIPARVRQGRQAERETPGIGKVY